MKNTFIIGIYCLLLFCCPKLSATEYGLYMKAYEVTGAERTSLLLDNGNPFEVKEWWEINFGLRLRNEIEYGTILQMDMNGNKTVRLGYVSISQSKRAPALIFDDALFVLNTSLVKDEWIEIALSLNIKDNKAHLKYADADTTFMVPLHGTTKIGALFGKGNAGDIAPVDIRDVRIKRDGQLIRHWILGKHNGDVCLDELEQAEAKASNPLWLVDNHIEWKKIFSHKYDNRVDVAFNSRDALFYFVSQDNVDIWNPFTKSKTAVKLQGGHPAMEHIEHLVYDTLTNHLFSYSLNERISSTLCLENGKWSLKERSLVEPTYANHARIYNPSDSCYYFFGGYGFYQYRNDLYRLKVTTGEIEKVDYSPLLAPRYSATLAVDGDELYVFGGRGNKLGKQEMEASFYNELCAIHLKTGESRLLWKGDASSFKSALLASSMYYVPEDSSFYTVCLNGGGVLWKIQKNKEGWTEVSKSMGIVQDWQECDVSFYASPLKKRLFLVVDKVLPDHTYDVSIYSINTPLLNDNEIEQKVKNHSIMSWWGWLLIVGTLCLLSMLVIRKKNHTAVKDVNEPKFIKDDEVESVEHEQVPVTNYFDRSKSAISLLGTFNVRDKEGQDITPLFTSRLKNLLILLVLYSEKSESGILGKKLTDILWGDKDDESARNNRNVTLRKLRVLLEKVGDVEIVNEAGFFRIRWGEGVFCDYRTVLKCIDEYKNSADSTDDTLLDQIFEILLYGPLLSNTFIDWLDDFKDAYSSLSIDLLRNLLDAKRNNPQMVLRIADILFLHDPLSEEALAARCSVYYTQGKKGLAKSVYDRFCKEYKESLGEDYQVPLLKLYQ